MIYQRFLAIQWGRASIYIFYKYYEHKPITLFEIPVSSHRVAQITPSKEKHKNPTLDLPEFLEVAVYLASTLTRLNLDIRSHGPFTESPSEAEAGVVGIDSKKDQTAEENLESVSSSSSPLPFSFPPAG